jgi:hypothetical protein
MIEALQNAFLSQGSQFYASQFPQEWIIRYPKP